MFDIFFPILVMLVFAGGAGLAFLIISGLFGRRTKVTGKDTPYESGIEPVGDTRDRFSIKFYMIAILFIIFDIEVVFLYPWAVIFNEPTLFLLVEMLVFVGILLVGYIYILRAGALKWD